MRTVPETAERFRRERPLEEQGGSVTMLPRSKGKRNDDLGVIVSLAVAIGMIVGAMAALWIAGGEVEVVAR